MHYACNDNTVLTMDNRDSLKMPVVSIFLGIVIKMYYGDHPPKHFHVIYNEYEAVVNIDTEEIIEGDLPPRVKRLVLEWTKLRKKELLENWKRVVKREQLSKIDPLE